MGRLFQGEAIAVGKASESVPELKSCLLTRGSEWHSHRAAGIT